MKPMQFCLKSIATARNFWIFVHQLLCYLSCVERTINMVLYCYRNQNWKHMRYPGLAGRKWLFCVSRTFCIMVPILWFTKQIEVTKICSKIFCWTRCTPEVIVESSSGELGDEEGAVAFSVSASDVNLQKRTPNSPEKLLVEWGGDL